MHSIVTSKNVSWPPFNVANFVYVR